MNLITFIVRCQLHALVKVGPSQGHSDAFWSSLTKRRQLSYTLRPSLLSSSTNEPSQIVFLSVSWVGWCLGLGHYDRDRNSLRIPHALPSSAKATALVSEHHSAPLARRTPTRSTGRSTAPQGRIQALWPCTSLFHSLTHIPPPVSLVHHGKDVLPTRGHLPLAFMDRVATDRHNECFRWWGKCSASLSKSCQKSPGSANGATAAVASPLFLAKSHDPLHKPIFLALKNRKLRHRKHNEALLRLTTQIQTQIRPEICSADSPLSPAAPQILLIIIPTEALTWTVSCSVCLYQRTCVCKGVYGQR